MARNEFGWQTAKDVPLYLKNGNARCNNDLPDNGLHLDPSQFSQSQPSYQNGKEYFAKPECNGDYNGESFDVVADNQYIYLFRAKGERVLLDRFVYKSENNSLQRLIESRFKLTGQRYKLPSSVVVGSDPTKPNTIGSSAAISVRDNFNQWFYEPAFEVPFTSQKVGATYCPVGHLTASLLSDNIAGHRFVLGSTCSNTNALKIATIRKGESEPFDVKDFSFKDDNNVAVVVPGISLFPVSTPLNAVTSLDSLTLATKVDDANGKEQSFDIELVMAVNMLNSSTDIRILHLPMTKFGGIQGFTDSRKPTWSHPDINTGKLTSGARLHFSNDGYVHAYWRGQDKKNIHSNMLYEFILNPHLVERGNDIITNWELAKSDQAEVRKLSWPYMMNHDFIAVGGPDNVNKLPVFRPAFGTYYEGNDAPLGNNFLTPLVFEYGVLIDDFNSKSGILRRTYVDALKIGGNRQFAFSQQDMFSLKSEFVGRVSTDLEMIGYIEGAPPVPKENMGRDQNGKWGYSAAASQISLAFDSETTVGATGDDSAGFQLNGEFGSGASIFGVSVYAYVNSSLAFTGSTGTTEEFSLGSTLTRNAFITGVPPSAECAGIQTPFQDACYKTEGGSKTELWHPHNEGSIFATSVQADSYALRHPTTNVLVGYQLDFNNTINTQQSYKL